MWTVASGQDSNVGHADPFLRVPSRAASRPRPAELSRMSAQQELSPVSTAPPAAPAPPATHTHAKDAWRPACHHGPAKGLPHQCGVLGLSLGGVDSCLRDQEAPSPGVLGQLLGLGELPLGPGPRRLGSVDTWPVSQPSFRSHSLPVSSTGSWSVVWSDLCLWCAPVEGTGWALLPASPSQGQGHPHHSAMTGLLP